MVFTQVNPVATKSGPMVPPPVIKQNEGLKNGLSPITPNQPISLHEIKRINQGPIELSSQVKKDLNLDKLSTLLSSYAFTEGGKKAIDSMLSTPLQNKKEIEARQNLIAELIENKDLRETIREIIGEEDIERMFEISRRLLVARRQGYKYAEDVLKKIHYTGNYVKFVESAPAVFANLVKKICALNTLLKTGKHQALKEKQQYLSFVENPHHPYKLKGLFDFTLKVDKHFSQRSDRIDLYNQMGEWDNIQSYIDLSRCIDKNETDLISEQEWLDRLLSKEYAIDYKTFADQMKNSAFEKSHCTPHPEEISKSLETIKNHIGELDALCALAEFCSQKGYVKPKLIESDSLSIQIKDGRHPVVETLVKKFVPNDVLIDKENRFHVITGPNAGGKSVYMEMIGQIACLAQTGCFVPATEATISIVDNFFTHSQVKADVFEGQSLFQAEMENLKKATEKATAKSLHFIMLDEPCRSTNPQEGEALAEGALLYLAKIGHSGLIATHFPNLPKRIEGTPGIINLKVSEKDHYKILPGIGQSLGLEIARKRGLLAEILRYAEKLIPDSFKKASGNVKNSYPIRDSKKDNQNSYSRLKKDLPLEELTEIIGEYCQTEQGKKELLHMLENPLHDIAKITQRQNFISFLKTAEDFRRNLSHALRNIGKEDQFMSKFLNPKTDYCREDSNKTKNNSQASALQEARKSEAEKVTQLSSLASFFTEIKNMSAVLEESNSSSAKGFLATIRKAQGELENYFALEQKVTQNKLEMQVGLLFDTFTAFMSALDILEKKKDAEDGHFTLFDAKFNFKTPPQEELQTLMNMIDQIKNPEQKKNYREGAALLQRFLAKKNEEIHALESQEEKDTVDNFLNLFNKEEIEELLTNAQKKFSSPRIDSYVYEFDLGIFETIHKRLWKREEGKKHRLPLLTLRKLTGKLDAYCALAEISIKNNYSRPNVVQRESTYIKIKEGRHPVVEAKAEKCVPNDALIDANNRFKIITGPNAGGKSVYMEQIALIALLAHIGSDVPATAATVSLLDGIFTHVNVKANIENGQSLFAAEVDNLDWITRNATKRSLILLDEACRGTNPIEGEAINEAVTKYLIDHGFYGLTATHFPNIPHRINGSGIHNLTVLENGSPYKVVFGIGKSKGLKTAIECGLPKEITDYAEKVLNKDWH